METMRFNAADYPMSYVSPISVGDSGSWIEHTPFAGALIEMVRPGLVVELAGGMVAKLGVKEGDLVAVSDLEGLKKKAR